jgi:hypothetical protein
MFFMQNTSQLLVAVNNVDQGLTWPGPSSNVNASIFGFTQWRHTCLDHLGIRVKYHVAADTVHTNINAINKEHNKLRR